MHFEVRDIWLSSLSLTVMGTNCCCCLVTQSLYNPMDCSQSGSSVHGILQARILGWVSFSRGSSQPRDQIHVSCIAGRFFPTESSGKQVLKSCWASNIPNQIGKQNMQEGHYVIGKLLEKRIEECFLGDSVVKNSPANAGYARHGFKPWVMKIPSSRKWQPTPVFLPGKSQGQRRLAGLQSMGLQRSWRQQSNWACMERGENSHRILEEQKPWDLAGSLTLPGSALAATSGVSRAHYSRDSDLKDVVLDELLPQHDDAELDAQLHEAAPGGALQDEKMQEGASDRQGRELSQAAVGV